MNYFQFNFLSKKNLSYDRDGAIWYKSTDFGDEKDRVLIRENEAPTYFASDLVYHKNKFDRKFDETPSWAKYYSWYVKETSVEYYTMAMDRWYNAEDGNIWISFPSADRNKIQEDDTITKRDGTKIS